MIPHIRGNNTFATGFHVKAIETKGQNPGRSLSILKLIRLSLSVGPSKPLHIKSPGRYHQSAGFVGRPIEVLDEGVDVGLPFKFSRFLQIIPHVNMPGTKYFVSYGFPVIFYFGSPTPRIHPIQRGKSWGQ
jgi:hypothetical protein